MCYQMITDEQFGIRSNDYLPCFLLACFSPFRSLLSVSAVSTSSLPCNLCVEITIGYSKVKVKQSSYDSL